MFKFGSPFGVLRSGFGVRRSGFRVPLEPPNTEPRTQKRELPVPTPIRYSTVLFAIAGALVDSNDAIKAASRAGVATIAFRCGGWSDSALHGALAIYDEPADLLGRLLESPLISKH